MHVRTCSTVHPVHSTVVPLNPQVSGVNVIITPYSMLEQSVPDY
jgi:hypothetical protein